MPHSNIHLLIVDDHAYVADSFEAYLATLDDRIRVSKATSVPQALAIAEAAEDLGIVLLDLHMPDVDGMTGLRRLREIRPNLPVAIISGDISPGAARAAMHAGANGFILKTMGGTAVVAAIRLIHAGERYFPANLFPQAAPSRSAAPNLTRREVEVLAALVTGHSNKQIAATLGVRPGAIALHLTNIYRKLDVTSRGQAVRRTFELGLHSDRRQY